MSKIKLIPWEEVEKMMFTEKEREEIHRGAQKRIALRMLKEARKSQNISQYELSKRSGISRSVISEIESGKRNVSIAKLTRLADALDTDLKIEFVKRKRV